SLPQRDTFCTSKFLCSLSLFYPAVVALCSSPTRTTLPCFTHPSPSPASSGLGIGIGEEFGDGLAAPAVDLGLCLPTQRHRGALHTIESLRVRQDRALAGERRSPAGAHVEASERGLCLQQHARRARPRLVYIRRPAYRRRALVAPTPLSGNE